MGWLHRYNAPAADDYHRRNGSTLEDGAENFLATLSERIAGATSVEIIGPSEEGAKDIIKRLKENAQVPEQYRNLDIEADARQILEDELAIFRACATAEGIRGKRGGACFRAYRRIDLPFQLLITHQKSSGVRGCLVVLAGEDTADGVVKGFYSEFEATVDMFEDVFRKLTASSPSFA